MKQADKNKSDKYCKLKCYYMYLKNMSTFGVSSTK